MRQTLPYTVTPGSEFRTAHQMTNHVTHSSELRKIKKTWTNLHWNFSESMEYLLLGGTFLEVSMFSLELIKSLKKCNLHSWQFK